LDKHQSTEKASTKDRIKFADTWVLLIRRATLERLQSNYIKFVQSVDTLISILYIEERTKVAEFRRSLHLTQPHITEIDEYILSLTHIVDLLKAKGYLTTEGAFAYGGGADYDTNEHQDEFN